MCGDVLSEGNYSKEHVFPKWLLRRFGLFNQSMALLNETRKIPYRNLTIPCCKVCNNDILSKIEKRINKAVEEGPKGLRHAGDWKLYVWIAKLFYGLLYKGGLIPVSKQEPEGDKIVSKTVLDSYSLVHTFLQASRKDVILVKPTLPGSLFVFEVQVPKEVRHQFDYRDSIDSLCVSIRMGRVGIVGCLQDSRIIFNENKNSLAKFEKIRLHPLQFLEICAGVFYRAQLFSRLPSYLFVEDGERKVAVPFGSMISEEWNQSEYAKILSWFTGGVISWLHDEKGHPKYVDIEEYPWPSKKSSRVQVKVPN